MYYQAALLTFRWPWLSSRILTIFTVNSSTVKNPSYVILENIFIYVSSNSRHSVAHEWWWHNGFLCMFISRLWYQVSKKPRKHYFWLIPHLQQIISFGLKLSWFNNILQFYTYHIMLKVHIKVSFEVVWFYDLLCMEWV